MRPSGRAPDQMREIEFTPGFAKHAEGSCLVKFGDTHVLCTASLEERPPAWLRDSGRGWVTAEYGMLPRATHQRTMREAARGGQSGRTQEIQRLIGRALRAATRLELMGERQIRVDCDVLQADGGTRTAAISGGYVALAQAYRHMLGQGYIVQNPLIAQVAAVSCGIYDGQPVLDLDYAEDSAAHTDANFVLADKGLLIEVQASAEADPFSEEQLLRLLRLARIGCNAIFAAQKAALAAIA
ncbi:MAG: ribonuclease PH [Pseudomonadota bacterium]